MGYRFLNSLPVKCWRLVFWNSNHLEVASGPFCLLLHSPWPLVFALCLFILFFLSLNLFCWKGFHFSWSNSLIFILIIAYLFFSLHFWIRDLIREFSKKYEILLICLFLLFFLFLASECLLFISFFWASFHSLSSLTLGNSLGEGFYLPEELNRNEPMFELKTQQENAHTQDVNSVAWNPVTENILASASDDGSAIIWCLKKENGDDL